MERGATLLEWAMPVWHVHEVHEVVVLAPRDVVWSALHEVTLREVPLFRALMTLRELPGLLTGRRWLTAGVDRPILAQMAGSGFVLLGERPPAEIALGLVARPWRPDGGPVRLETPEAFLAFDAPGWAKAVLAFRLEARDGTTRLLSETRVLATDTSARRRFRAYWFVVGWASGASRTAWLGAVDRLADRRRPD